VGRRSNGGFSSLAQKRINFYKKFPNRGTIQVHGRKKERLCYKKKHKQRFPREEDNYKKSLLSAWERKGQKKKKNKTKPKHTEEFIA